jgi:hypothetical protein
MASCPRCLIAYWESRCDALRAENERLRGLVESAYREGYNSGYGEDGEARPYYDIDRGWDDSESLVALEAGQ